MNIGSLFKNLTNFQFPYAIGAEPYYSTPLWELYEGTRKRDSYPVTIFKGRLSFDNNHHNTNFRMSMVTEQDLKRLVSHAAHMSKIIRVPGICPVLDVFDDNNVSNDIFVVTEVVKPLQPQLISNKINSQGILLGISDLFKLFGIIDPLFIIGNLSINNLYIDKNGRWVLFGLECCFNKSKDKFDSFQFKDHIKIWNQICNNSDDNGNADTFDLENLYDSTEPWLLDSILLGRLINQLYTVSKLDIPKEWKPLIGSVSQGKLSMRGFIQKMETTNIWTQNELLHIYDELKELNIKTDKDKLILMKRFENYYLGCSNRQQFQGLTVGFIENLIIPEIVATLKWIISIDNGLQIFSNNLINLLTILLDLVVNQLISSNFNIINNDIKELLYTFFKINDRQIRFILLIFLPKLIQLLPRKSLDFSGRCFTFFLQGMLDTDKTLRLQTLKTIPYILEEITERQLNNEILRSIAKTQVDPEEEIRTWTVFVVIKISNQLTGINNRDSVLATIYTKSLKDPCITTKLAALYGLKVSVDLFNVEVIANKILSVIAPGLLDKDKIIRMRSKELFNIYLKKLETESDLKFAKSNDDNEKENRSDNDNAIKDYIKEFESINDSTNENKTMDNIIDRFVNGLKLNREENETYNNSFSNVFVSSQQPFNNAHTNTINNDIYGDIIAEDDKWDDDFGFDNWDEPTTPSILNKPNINNSTKKSTSKTTISDNNNKLKKKTSILGNIQLRSNKPINKKSTLNQSNHPNENNKPKSILGNHVIKSKGVTMTKTTNYSHVVKKAVKKEKVKEQQQEDYDDGWDEDW